MNVQVYVHQADVKLAEGTDPAAVGAMVTVAAGRATGASTTVALTVIRGLFARRYFALPASIMNCRSCSFSLQMNSTSSVLSASSSLSVRVHGFV